MEVLKNVGDVGVLMATGVIDTRVVIGGPDEGRIALYLFLRYFLSLMAEMSVGACSLVGGGGGVCSMMVLGARSGWCWSANRCPG